MKRSLLLTGVVIAVATFGATYGCSSDSQGSEFNGNGNQGGDGGGGDGGTYAFDPGGGGMGDAAEGGVAMCTAQAVPNYAPLWRAPTTFFQAKCTAQEIDDFYTNCLTPPLGTATCANYEAQHTTCGACLTTDQNANALGPVISHGAIMNNAPAVAFTLNLSGCIARELGDVSSQGCGAAYQEAVDCKEQSCAACLSTGGSFTDYLNCEGNAGANYCMQWASAESNACGDLTMTSANACLPASTDGTEQVFKRIAPLFCGSAPGDAG